MPAPVPELTEKVPELCPALAFQPASPVLDADRSLKGGRMPGKPSRTPIAGVSGSDEHLSGCRKYLLSSTTAVRSFGGSRRYFKSLDTGVRVRAIPASPSLPTQF